MKLLSMTDYVQEKQMKFDSGFISSAHFTSSVIEYCDFLNKPLKLGMFIPCEKGNPLEPLQMCCSGADCGCRGMPVNVTSQKQIDDYLEAESKVLFKGCFYDKASQHVFTDSYEKPVWCTVLENQTVEDLLKIDFELELTETAKSHLRS